MLDTIQAHLARAALRDDQVSLRWLTRLLFKPFQPQADIRHIVIYRVGNIGDTVVAIPAMTAVRRRFPNAQITLITSAGNPQLPGAAAVLEAFPGLVNRIIAYLPHDIKSIAGLQQLKTNVLEPGPIDLWIHLPITMETFQRGIQGLFLARWLGGRSAFGFTVLLPDRFQMLYARYYKTSLPRTCDWLLHIVQTGLQLELSTTPGDLAYFQPPAVWEPSTHGLDAHLPILVVNAGAKLAIKRWPAEYFQKTLRELQTQFPTLQIVLLGNQEERSLNDQIASGLIRPALNVSGQLSISETWSLLTHATAVLSNDTGTMHMAGLLQKPVIAPMSGQYPTPIWHPPGLPLHELHKPVPCSPCFKTACPLHEQICMTLLTPELMRPILAQVLTQALSETVF